MEKVFENAGVKSVLGFLRGVYFNQKCGTEHQLRSFRAAVVASRYCLQNAICL